MCTGKGWDVAYYGDHVGIEQHFCRTYGDCGHSDNSIESAAEMCAQWHDEQARLWRSGQHSTMLHYKGEEPAPPLSDTKGA